MAVPSGSFTVTLGDQYGFRRSNNANLPTIIPLGNSAHILYVLILFDNANTNQTRKRNTRKKKVYFIILYNMRRIIITYKNVKFPLAVKHAKF